MKQKEKIYDFAMIGHPGAGKTTLATGLFAVAQKNFVAQPDSITGNYLANAAAVLQQQKWPDPSQGNPIKLCFTIHRNHQKTQIRFDDFPGERIGEDSFIREVVKKSDGEWPDGVLLLVNCAAPQLSDPRQTALMKADFQNFVSKLAEHHVPIALVVTAWDRMSTDRKETAEQFEEFILSLATILNNAKACWKRFNVSVSGEIAEQQKPALNPENIEKPFVWLLRQQQSFFRRNWLAFLLAFLILLLAGALSYWIVSKGSQTEKDPQIKTKGPNESKIVVEPPPPQPQTQVDPAVLREIEQIAKTGDLQRMLETWADWEDNYGRKPEYKEDETVVQMRTKCCQQLAEKIFLFVGNFELERLRKLCREIDEVKESIPYLQKTKLARFASDFLRWDREFKVRVIAECDRLPEGKNAAREVECVYAKIKCTDMDNWTNAPEGRTTVSIQISKPEQQVEYLVGFIGKYRWQTNGKQESDRFSFQPAKDGDRDSVYHGSFGKGYSIRHTFTASSLANNGFPIRLADLLHRDGVRTPHDLCDKADVE